MVRILIVAGVAAVLIFLNLRSSRGSLAFEEHFFQEAFGPSFGWPVKAAAPANDAGAHLVRASVVMGGTSVLRDVFKDPRYPHLAVNRVHAGVDLFVAGLLLVAAGFFRRTRRPDAVKP